MRPFAQFSGRREGPVTLGVDDRRADFHIIDNNVYRCAHFPRTVEGWTGVVRGAVAGEGSRSRADIVYYRGNHRGRRPGGIHRKGEHWRVGGDVSDIIAGVNAQVIRPVSQYRIRRKGPVAAAVDRGGANLHAVIQHVNDGTRLAGAAEGWRGVIGHLPGGKRAGCASRGVVADRNDRRHLWRSQIDFDAPGVGRLADVALRIRRSDSKVMRPFAEGGFRSKCPGTGAVCCHRTNLRSAIKNGDDAVRLGATGQGWRSVVGWITAWDRRCRIACVIRHAGNHRRGRDGVDNDGDPGRRGALIACRVGGGHGQGMAAVVQRRRRVAPGAGRTDNNGAQRVAVIVHRNGVPGRACSGQGRTVVVGALPVSDWADDRAYVIGHRTDGWCGRIGEVDGDGRDRRLPAGRAGAGIRGGDGEGVWAFRERQQRRVAPVAVCIRNNFGQRNQRPIQINGDDATRIGGAGKGRRGVIGGFIFHIASDGIGIIVDCRNHRHRWQNKRGVRYVKGGCRACITCGVRGEQRQRRGIQLGRGEGDGEGASRRDPGPDDIAAGVTHRHRGSVICRTGQRRALCGNGDIGWRCRKQRIHRHAEIAGAGGGIPRRVTCGNREGMRPFRKRGVGCPGPCPVRLNHHDHRRRRAINRNGYARTRLANPGEGWGTVAGVKHAVSQLAVRDGVNLRHGRCLRIDRHAKDRADRAQVTRVVHRGDGDIQRTIGLCWQGV